MTRGDTSGLRHHGPPEVVLVGTTGAVKPSRNRRWISWSKPPRVSPLRISQIQPGRADRCLDQSHPLLGAGAGFILPILKYFGRLLPPVGSTDVWAAHQVLCPQQTGAVLQALNDTIPSSSPRFPKTSPFSLAFPYSQVSSHAA